VDQLQSHATSLCANMATFHQRRRFRLGLSRSVSSGQVAELERYSNPARPPHHATRGCDCRWRRVSRALPSDTCDLQTADEALKRTRVRPQGAACGRAGSVRPESADPGAAEIHCRYPTAVGVQSTTASSISSRKSRCCCPRGTVNHQSVARRM